MTLLIQDSEIRELLTMETYIDTMEKAYKEYASTVAVNRPRVRWRAPSKKAPLQYFGNVIVGAVPGYGTSAVRVDSTLRSEEIVAGIKRAPTKQPTQRSWGLVLLYSLETAELLAIMHDFTISGMRVGATSALGVRHLASPEASVLGLLGTGKQARTHLEAISKVRSIRKVNVYSPSEEHRREFCKEMSSALNIDVQPKENAKAVVDDADIICCATNTQDPVLKGAWLKKGQLVITIVNTDVTLRRTEVDEATFVASDLIVISDKDSVFANRQMELLEPIERGLFNWDKVVLLGDILIGTHKGRTKPDELIYYKNNTGMGIQFAAAGAVVYEHARKKGIGKELPTEWFGTDLSEWYRKGYYPSY